MKANLLLTVSLAANLVLAGGVLALAKKFSRLPNYMPSSVSVVYITNAPPVNVENPAAAAPRTP